jgi:hypothetical protein
VVVRQCQVAPGLQQGMSETCKACNGEGEVIEEEDICDACMGRKVLVGVLCTPTTTLAHWLLLKCDSPGFFLCAIRFHAGGRALLLSYRLLMIVNAILVIQREGDL